jgi:hypothetical protein
MIKAATSTSRTGRTNAAPRQRAFTILQHDYFDQSFPDNDRYAQKPGFTLINVQIVCRKAPSADAQDGGSREAPPRRRQKKWRPGHAARGAIPWRYDANTTP